MARVLLTFELNLFRNGKHTTGLAGTVEKMKILATIANILSKAVARSEPATIGKSSLTIEEIRATNSPDGIVFRQIQRS
jgi:hypothetical protein